jgi:parallel beta-helix repeat protein
VKNAEIRLNHGVGVYGHDHSTIVDNFIHDNGQMGFSGYGGPISITGNEIARNNKDSFEWQNEAGGGKCYKCSDVTISGNYVHDNVGPGIWCDTDCIRSTIANNLVERNTGPGIYYEISYDGVIHDNVLENNATDLQANPLHVGGGIGVDTSSNVEVFGNTLADNANGIIVISTHRGSGKYGAHVLRNVHIHDNTTHQAGGTVGMVNHVGDARFWSSQGNRFSHNTYFLGPNRRIFIWQGQTMSPEQWKAAGQDTTGTFVTGS